MAESLITRITRAPHVHDKDRGAEAVSALADHGLAEDPAVRDLIGGAGGSSPYLCALLKRDAAWAAVMLEASPEAALAAVIETMRGEVREAGAISRTMTALRVAKRRAALLIALADLGGAWDLGAVTGALTDLADAALDEAVKAALRNEAARGFLGLDAAQAETDTGYLVLAMGKHGARELNYSSDIDFVCFFDEDRWDPGDYPEVKARLIRVTRLVVKLLSEMTGDGYVFRTDLRLRPDPGSTPVCMGLDAAERYYESFGRTWERAVYIKARAVAGDIQAGENFLGQLAPFVWRRHLDFAAIEDAFDMRQRIDAHKGHGTVAVRGHDLKLGAGGIREIEFFAQTRQLICGGRDPSLRDRTTLGALQALTDADWVKEETRATLHDDYVAHRTLEHRIQMIDDAQTHQIPQGDEAVARLAALSGWSDASRFLDDVEARLRRVHDHCSELFSPVRQDAEEKEAPPPEAADLGALGFNRPEAAEALIERWLSGQIPATRADRARTKFARLARPLLTKLAGAASPDDAIADFDRFLSTLPAGIQILSLFEANPQLLDLIVEICSVAPNLATYLGRNSGVLDAVLDRDFFAPAPPLEDLRRECEAALASAPDYEAKLDAARRWSRERRFQTGVQMLRRLVGHVEAGRAYSDIAETALGALYPLAVEEMTRRYGPPPGAGAAVVAMGKLGSRQMTATSDLDLIVIYDPAGREASDGPKSLDAAQYYGRLTQTLISALTVKTNEGALYEVDMRLRPSGRSGPVATQIEAFRRYQRDEAWTWEHLALTRARVVSGAPDVGAAATACIDEALARERDTAALIRDIREMSDRLDAANAAMLKDPWALKHAHGGLMDLDFLLQGGSLVHPGSTSFGELADAGWLSQADAADAQAAADLQLLLQQMMRVASVKGFTPAEAGEGLKLALAEAGGVAGFVNLERRLVAAQHKARRIFEARFHLGE